MKTIYKYNLRLIGETPIYLPKGAQVLSVGYQHSSSLLSASTLKIWILHNTDTGSEINEERKFVVYPTGVEIKDLKINKESFIGTVFLDELVFHVFEVKND